MATRRCPGEHDPARRREGAASVRAPGADEADRALRTRGPLTATQAARLLGESSGTCSFHLRQLAKYGLVEETGGGTGREKPWRATTTSTAGRGAARTRRRPRRPACSSEVLAESYFTQLMRWLEVRPAGERGMAARPRSSATGSCG